MTHEIDKQMVRAIELDDRADDRRKAKEAKMSAATTEVAVQPEQVQPQPVQECWLHVTASINEESQVAGGQILVTAGLKTVVYRYEANAQEAYAHEGGFVLKTTTDQLASITNVDKNTDVVFTSPSESYPNEKHDFLMVSMDGLEFTLEPTTYNVGEYNEYIQNWPTFSPDSCDWLETFAKITGKMPQY